jgi:hypothetical protein
MTAQADRLVHAPPSSYDQTTAALEDVARLAVRDLSASGDLSGHDRSDNQALAAARPLGNPAIDLADADDVRRDAGRDTCRPTVALAALNGRKVTN